MNGYRVEVETCSGFLMVDGVVADNMFAAMIDALMRLGIETLELVVGIRAYHRDDER